MDAAAVEAAARSEAAIRVDETHDAVDAATAYGWAWRWTAWASWPVSPAILWVAALAVTVDVASAWLGRPEWYLGRILVSPALPLAVALVVLVGPTRLGLTRARVRAWREFLALTAAGIVLAATAYAQHVSGWREVGGVLVNAVGEEVVYRLAAFLLVGAVCARVAGREWRDTASWGDGPVIGGLVGAALVFSVLPGHVEQMTGFGNVAPFASLAILLGYATIRTGSLLPSIAVHALLDLVALAYFAGEVGAVARIAVACTLLVGLAIGLMLAGRRLGLRRRVPAVIDLR
jgi:hypothetical protein